VDLAVGNLFGSNLINLGILASWVCSMSRPLVAGGVVQTREHRGNDRIMTGIAGAEMMYRPQKKALRWMSAGAFILLFCMRPHLCADNGRVKEPR